jgi:CMP-N-acetylneuraminic acid synthetase
MPDTVARRIFTASALSVAQSCGATPIRRPGEPATDAASSEVAWCHALDRIEELGQPVDLVCALQATLT